MQAEQSNLVPFVQIEKLRRADPFPVQLCGLVFTIYYILQLKAPPLNSWPLIGRREQHLLRSKLHFMEIVSLMEGCN